MTSKMYGMLAILFALATACGEESLVPADRLIDTTDHRAGYVLPTPFVEALAPSSFAAGDTVSVFGSGFVPERYGRSTLHLLGSFTPAGGQPVAIDMQRELRYINPGRAEFVFEADVPPAGFGGQVGSYTGHVWAVNRGLDGTIAAQQSEPLMQSVNVEPSIVAWNIQPADQGCTDKAISATVEGTRLAYDIELVGLEPASVLKPITLETAYVRLADAGLPIIPGTAPEQLQTASYTLTGGNQVALTGIDFGPLPDGALTATGALSVKATDGNGQSIQRSFLITFYPQQYVDYNGSIELAEIYDAQAVSGCLPGGEYGRSTNYSESSSESRQRSVSYSGGGSIAIPGKILNLSFGINVSESVSSSSSQSLAISGHILPNQWGAFYRQTLRLLRRGDVVQVNACGVKNSVGEAVVTDWTWAPDLAITRDGTCPPLPPSNLPPAATYIY